MYINKSLTFLEQVVVALSDRRREHIPFRQSKLTHCLKDSIGGRSNTLLIANVWGEKSQLEETVSIFIMIKMILVVKAFLIIDENIPTVQTDTLSQGLDWLA